MFPLQTEAVCSKLRPGLHSVISSGMDAADGAEADLACETDSAAGSSGHYTTWLSLGLSFLGVFSRRDAHRGQVLDKSQREVTACFLSKMSTKISHPDLAT